MQLPRTIETERLLLRRWEREDREPFAAMGADPRVMEYFPKTLTEEQSEWVIERIKLHFKEHGYGLWAVEVKGGERFIGFIGLMVPKFEVCDDVQPIRSFSAFDGRMIAAVFASSGL